MGTFAQTTKPWIRSAIAQRKMLIRTNRSHVDHITAILAIDRLEKQLNAYPYDNDVYLARFIINRSDDIAIILPGEGSTSHLKKQTEWDAIKKTALMLDLESNKIRQILIPWK